MANTKPFLAECRHDILKKDGVFGGYGGSTNCPDDKGGVPPVPSNSEGDQTDSRRPQTEAAHLNRAGERAMSFIAIPGRTNL